MAGPSRGGNSPAGFSASDSSGADFVPAVHFEHAPRRVGLDPTSLKLFISVVEEGTIAAASARAHITAAAVSKRVSELEETLGTVLLRRTNKGVAPTAAGLELLNLARSALSGLDGIYLQMHDYAAGISGRVKLCADLSAMVQFLPAEIASFIAAYPSVQIHPEERSSTLVMKAVAENAAEVGACLATEQAGGLEAFPYHQDRLTLVAPADHPLASRRSVSLLETLDFDYVGFAATDSIQRQLLKAAADAGRALKVRLQVSGYDVLCHMVHAGLGLGVLPEAVAVRNLGAFNIRAIALDEPWAKRELKIYVRSYAALSAAGKRLVDHLKR